MTASCTDSHHRSRMALLTGIGAILSPPVTGIATRVVGVSTPVAITIILLSCVPAIPRTLGTYVWLIGTIKAIRAAEKGELSKSRAITSVLADTLRALPTAPGGEPSHK